MYRASTWPQRIESKLIHLTKRLRASICFDHLRGPQRTPHAFRGAVQIVEDKKISLPLRVHVEEGIGLDRGLGLQRVPVGSQGSGDGIIVCWQGLLYVTVA